VVHATENSLLALCGGPIRFALLTLLIVTVASGCGPAVELPRREDDAPSAAAATSTPNVVATPTKLPPHKAHGTPLTPPTPQPSEAYGQQVVADFGPPVPLAQQFAQYGLFVIGRVVEVLPAQWTTPDGQRPADPFAENSSEVYIITPAIIALDGPALLNREGADLASGRIVVAVFGGQVGRDTVATTDSSQRLLEGEHVLLGLSRHPYLNGDVEMQFATPVGVAWNLGLKYVLAPDGLALQVSPGALPISTAELIAQIRAIGSIS
jgi:hypothetical protein